MWSGKNFVVASMALLGLFQLLHFSAVLSASDCRISCLISNIENFSSSSSSTRFRLRKQNMCTVRGELCIVSGSTRLLYKLWTSFGYAWAQMLCSMPQKHVRNGGFQVSNIFASNFAKTWLSKQPESSLRILSTRKHRRSNQKTLKLLSIGAKAKRKQKHKRATFIFQ